MKIGLLYEGMLDKTSLDVIIRRLMRDFCGNTEIEFDFYPAHGPITERIEAAVEVFFDSGDCDFAVFISDHDKNGSSCKEISKWIKTVALPRGNRIILACPNPHFEQWFFSEENSLKSFFDLKGSKIVPYPHLLPKERMYKIAMDFGDIAIDVDEAKQEIASNLDFKILKDKDETFNKFFESLKRLALEICLN